MRSYQQHIVAFASTFLLLKLFVAPAYSQTSQLFVDIDLEGASVWIDSLHVGETDVDGRLSVDGIESGDRTLLIKMLGYQESAVVKHFRPGMRTRHLGRLYPMMDNYSVLEQVQTTEMFIETGYTDVEIFIDSLYVGNSGDSGYTVLHVPAGDRLFSVRDRNGILVSKSFHVPESALRHKLVLFIRGIDF